MDFRHEYKHEITAYDRFVLRARLRAICRSDPHAIDGKYEIRSLYFDDLDDTALREKIDGVNMTSYEKADGDEDGPFAVGVAVTEAVENGTTEIVWVSSGAIQDEQSNEQVSGGNQDFFLNAISWLYGGENGEVETTIHAKAFDYGYLTMSSSTGTILALLMVLVIPLGWLIVGAVVRSRRKRQ